MVRLAWFVTNAVLCFPLAQSEKLRHLTDGTELKLAFLIHRHGDRTPVESSIKYSDNEEELEDLTKPYGYGQLTNVGKRRSYDMGKFIRERYDALLSKEYNSSELYLRSTDSTRAKMTALASMAAVFPPDSDNWSKDINWVPVPYTTLPAKYDYNLAILNCPVLTDAYKTKMESNSSQMDPYRHLFRLFGKYESSLEETPLLMYQIYDLFCSQASLGLPLQPELLEAWPKVKEAAGEAVDVLFGSEDYLALQAGPFLNEFYEESSAVMAGNDTQKLRVYSAHDVTVYYWMSAAKVRPKQGVPYYNAVFALELRRVVETGKYVVLPLYVNTPGQPVQYLKVEGCGTELCDIDEFREITAPYTLDEKTWRKECEFDEDVEIDDLSL